MKFYTIIFLLFLPLKIIAQEYISSNSLNIIDGIGYYKDKKYTGKVIDKTGAEDITYPYNDGLINGVVRTKNEYIFYKNGIIKKYNYKLENGVEIVSFENIDLSKPITSIKIGIRFENELKNDNNLYKNPSEEFYADSSEFKFGIFIYYLGKQTDFIELNNFKFISVDFCWGKNGWIYNRASRKNKLPNEFTRDVELIYVDKILYKTTTGEEINVPFKTIKFIDIK